MTKELIRDSTGKWLNSLVFCEEGKKFIKNGYYITDPKDSSVYNDYWDEQLDRCIHGYEVGGSKITGDHYKYLNFTTIVKLKKVNENSRVGKKVVSVPDFWDGDYDYFWCLDIAKNGVLNDDSQASTKLEKETAKHLDIESRKQMAIKIVERLKLRVKPHPDYLEGGNHMIVGKARRKGYSYKNASICTNIYNSVRNSLTVVGAFDKKYLYPTGTMGMASAQLSFLNEYTAWAKAREYVDKQEHKRASYEKTINGNPVESGYMSEIMAITFKDNPDAARGKDAMYVLFEEAGKFPNLKEAYNGTYPGLTAGGHIITGQILIFGTGGDMESGTVDFADMFYNPIQYGLMPFFNIWDENAENSVCGFFLPVYMNMEGFYDEQGNSDIAGAKAKELEERARIKKSATSSKVLQDRKQEFCMSPSEAFLTVSTNDFPTEELQEQLNRVRAHNLHLIKGKPVTLVPEIIEGERNQKVIDPFTNLPVEVAPRRRIKVNLDLAGKLEPLYTYRPKDKNIDGAVVIYEMPEPNAPKGLYKTGHDPYRMAQSNEAVPSIGVIYIYKTVMRGGTTKNIIVASFAGRPGDPDNVNRIAEMLCELYNCELMYENEVTHVSDWFKKRNKLHLLAAQPDAVISANINDSKVARVYGIHMTEKLKDAGEKYIKKWLLTERDVDENGNVLLNLHFIYDPALLEELILYNRKGNFDRVMALMILMFQLAEDDEEQEHEAQGTTTTNEEDLLELMQTQFSNGINYN